MAYNRWLSHDYYRGTDTASDHLEHHGVKGQQWGVKNGPPYPLDRSKSDGHRLIRGDGSPQGKKRYKTSEKTAYKRAKRKARTDEELERARKFYGKDEVTKQELEALRRADRDIKSHHVTDPDQRLNIMKDHADHQDDITYSVWNSKEKQEMLTRAYKDHDYDPDFIWKIRDEDWYFTTNTTNIKKQLKEYAKYLDAEGGDKIKAEALLANEVDKNLEYRVRKMAYLKKDGTLNDRGQDYYRLNGDGSLSFDEMELLKKYETKRGTSEDKFYDYMTLKAGLNTSKLPAGEKSNKERELLKLWYKKDPTDLELETAATLHQKISRESGNWYFGDPKTEAFRKALDETRMWSSLDENFRKYPNDFRTKMVMKSRRDLCKVVLKDIGYEVNDRNVNLIYYMVFDD